MEVLLAWGVYLSLGVIIMALAWWWLFPRLPRGARLTVLALYAALALLALAVTSQLPRDYQPGDLNNYARGGAAIFAQLCVAVVGAGAALVASARRNAPAAELTAVGVYLAGAGIALYLVLGGRATVEAPALVLVGAAVAVAGGCALAGLPRLLAPLVGLCAGAAAAFSAETLRGPGNPGGGPGAPSTTMALPAMAVALLLLFGAALLARAYWRPLARPLLWAGVALASTALALALRGPGEWAPGPGAGSTTLYGLPLTVLAVVVSLAILDSTTEGRDALRPETTPETVQPRRGRRLAPALSLAAVLLVTGGLGASWRPATEACAFVPYADSSALSPGSPRWAVSPVPAAQRGAPAFAEFAGHCAHRTYSLSQIVYVTYPTCKWAQVDDDYPLVQASGVLQSIDLSRADSPWIHTSHDLELDVAVDPSSAWLVVDGKPGSRLHVEVETGPFPSTYRPVAGDRVTVAGRWIFDCGHDPATEIHPAAVVASEHDEWRAGLPGGPQKVRVLRVWMNSAPGTVHVPLAPFEVKAGFPSLPAGQSAEPLVQVASGPANLVRWSVEGGEPGAGTGPQAAVRIEPPPGGSSAYFEVLLGYRGLGATQGEPAAYTLTFDSLRVNDDLRHLARNTTGLPSDLVNPQLALPGTGNWFMQAVVNHVGRTLLTNAPVESGHDYSLASVSPVRLLAPGDEPLRLLVTGYAENDPSDGVELASGSIEVGEGESVIQWDAGSLASLCCGRALSYTPPHRAWTLSYHVSKPAP